MNIFNFGMLQQGMGMVEMQWIQKKYDDVRNWLT